MSSTTASLHFGPEWLRKPSISRASSAIQTSSAQATATNTLNHNTSAIASSHGGAPVNGAASTPAATTTSQTSYSSLLTPTVPATDTTKPEDASHPFRYSKEQMLQVWKEGGGRGGLGLEVERWAGVVSEIGGEPAGMREWDEKLFAQPLNSSYTPHGRRNSHTPLSLSTAGVGSGKLGSSAFGGALGSPRERYGGALGSPMGGVGSSGGGLGRRRKEDGTSDHPSGPPYRPRQLSLGTTGTLSPSGNGPSSPHIPSPNLASGNRSRLGGPSFDGVLGETWVRRKTGDGRLANGSASGSAGQADGVTEEQDSEQPEDTTNTAEEKGSVDGNEKGRAADSGAELQVSDSLPEKAPDNPQVNGYVENAQSSTLEEPHGPLQNGTDVRVNGNGGQINSSNAGFDAPGLSAPAEIMDNASVIWSYKDPTGQIQGPFTSAMMQNWFTGGYFPPELLIQRTRPPIDGPDSGFAPLAEYQARIVGPPGVELELFLRGMELVPPRPPNLPVPAGLNGGMAPGLSPNGNLSFAGSIRTPTSAGFDGSFSSQPSVASTPTSAVYPNHSRNTPLDPFFTGGGTSSTTPSSNSVDSSPAFSHGIPASGFGSGYGAIGSGNGGLGGANAIASGIAAMNIAGAPSPAERQRRERQELWRVLRESELNGNQAGNVPSRSGSVGSAGGNSFANSFGGMQNNQQVQLPLQFQQAQSAFPLQSLQTPHQQPHQQFANSSISPFVGPRLTHPQLSPAIQHSLQNPMGQPSNMWPPPSPSHQQHQQQHQMQNLGHLVIPQQPYFDQEPMDPSSPWHSVMQPNQPGYDMSGAQQQQQYTSTPWQHQSMPQQRASLPLSNMTSPLGDYGFSSAHEQPPQTNVSESPAAIFAEPESILPSTSPGRVPDVFDAPAPAPAPITPSAPQVAVVEEPATSAVPDATSAPAVEPVPEPTPQPKDSAPAASQPSTRRKSTAPSKQRTPAAPEPTPATPAAETSTAVEQPTVPNPWNTSVLDDGSATASLREIQEAEAKRSEAKKAAEREREKAQRAASAAQAQAQAEEAPVMTTTSWGLPAVGGRTAPAAPAPAPASPVTTPSTSVVWGAAAATKLGAGAKKSMKQILEEEEKRKKAAAAALRESAAAAAAVSPAPAAAAKRGYADSAKSIVPNGGGAWTTVGASGKATPPVVGVAAAGPLATSRPAAPASAQLPARPVNGASTPTSSTPAAKAPASNAKSASKSNGATASDDAPTPSPEFIKWTKEALKGLTGVNVDDFIQMLLTFPLDPSDVVLEIISDSVYSNSATLDGRRFASEFCARRKADAAGRVGKGQSGSFKPSSLADIVKTQPKQPQTEWAYKVVKKKGKGSRAAN